MFPDFEAHGPNTAASLPVRPGAIDIVGVGVRHHGGTAARIGGMFVGSGVLVDDDAVRKNLPDHALLRLEVRPDFLAGEVFVG